LPKGIDIRANRRADCRLAVSHPKFYEKRQGREYVKIVAHFFTDRRRLIHVA
jgi:hypothetical protein